MKETWNNLTVEFKKRLTECVSKNLETQALFQRIPIEKIPIQEWVQSLCVYPIFLIDQGFERVSERLRVMPVPADIHLSIREIQAQRTQKSHATEFSKKYGWLREKRFDENGIECRIDPETGEKCYRAKDCDEGRSMLLFLREMSEKPRGYYRQDSPGEVIRGLAKAKGPPSKW